MLGWLGRIVVALGFLFLAAIIGLPMPALPPFAGSLAGGILGIAAAVLMLLSIAYAVLKPLAQKTRMGRVIGPSAALRIHVWIGTAATALVAVHFGLALRSPMGAALVLTIGLVVISGGIGRYHLRRLTAEVGDEEQDLAALRQELARRSGARARSDDAQSGAGMSALIDAVADLEASRRVLRLAARALRRWMIVHVIASIATLGLIAVHVWSMVRLGLRWWP